MLPVTTGAGTETVEDIMETQVEELLPGMAGPPEVDTSDFALETGSLVHRARKMSEALDDGTGGTGGDGLTVTRIGSLGRLPRKLRRLKTFSTKDHGVSAIDLDAGGSVYTAAFSPDGGMLVYSSGPGFLRMAAFSSDAWERIRPPVQADGAIHAIAFSPSGDLLVYAGLFNSVRVLDARTWEPIDVTLQAGEGVLTASFSPDGETLAYGGYDKNINIVSTKTWKPLLAPLESGGWVRTAAFSPNGAMFVHAGDDKMVWLMSTHSWQPIRAPLEASEWIRTLAFSPDGSMLAYGGDDRRVSLVSTQTWERVVDPLESLGKILKVTFSQDGGMLAYSSQDETVRLVNTKTWDLVRAPLRAGGKIRTAQFSLDGEMLAYAGFNDKRINLTSMKTWDHIRRPLAADRWVVTAAFSPDSSVLAYAGEDKVVQLMSTRTWEPLPSSLDASGTIFAVAFSSDGALLAYGGQDERVRIADTESWAQCRAPIEAGGLVNTITFSPNSKFLIFAGENGQVVLMSTECWTIEHVFKVGKPILTAVVSPDGDILAYAGHDEKVNLVSMQTFTPLRKPLQTVGSAWTIAFSPDGTMLAFSGFNDQRVNIVDTRTWHEVRPPLQAGKQVATVAFSPDGGMLAYVGSDRATIVSTETWQFIRAPLKSFGKLRTVAFSPDGSMFAYVGEDRQVRVLMCPPHHQPYAFDTQEPLVYEICECIRNSTRDSHAEILTWLDRYGGLFVRPSKAHGGRLPLEVAITYSKSDLVKKLLEKKPRLAGFNMEQLFREALYKRDRTTLIALLKVFSSTGKNSDSLLAIPRDVDDLCIAGIARIFPDILVKPFEEMHLVEIQEITTGVLEQPIYLAKATEYEPWAQRFVNESVGESAVSMAKRVAWAGLGRREILRMLLRIGKPQIFNTKSLRLVVEVLWKQHFRKLFLGFFLMQLVYIALVAVFASDVARGSEGLAGHVCGILSVVLAVLLLLVEAVEMYHADKREYFSGWHFLDFALHAMVITSVILSQIETPDKFFRPWVGTTMLLLFSNNLQFLRGFERTASMVKMILTILNDIIPFTIILVTVLVGFAFFFWLTFPAEATGYKTLTQSLLSTFIMGVVGELEGDDIFSENTSPILAEFMFVLLMFIVLIVMLNLLIALMGSSYEKVMENFTAELLRERAAIIVHIMGLIKLFPGSLRRLEEETRWFHVLVPSSIDEADLHAGEWSGTLRAVKRELTTHTKCVNSNIDQRLNKMQSEMNDLRYTLDKIHDKLSSLTDPMAVPFSRPGTAFSVR